MADDVKKWLDSCNLGKYGTLFSENEIDLGTLPLLSEADLKELGLPLGARRKLQAAIAQLPRPEPRPPPSTPAGPTPSSIDRGTSAHPPPEPKSGLAVWERNADERKPATVMFADITGSTALTEHLDAEDTHDLLCASANGHVLCAAWQHGGLRDKHGKVPGRLPASYDEQLLFESHLRLCAREEDREHWREGYRLTGMAV